MGQMANPQAQDESTPEEDGGLIFAKAFRAAINAANLKGDERQMIARMMAGAVGYAAGMVAENFGVAASVEMLMGTAALVEKSKADLGVLAVH